MNKLLKAIQSKYVGTAEEHALLAELVRNVDEAIKEREKWHKEELNDIRKAAENDRRLAEQLLNGHMIDVAAYHWMSNPIDWNLEALAFSMLGRGLGSKQLQKVLDAVIQKEGIRLDKEKTS